MSIYLPIAEMPVNVFVILLLGGVTGILAGMFGVGGGFLMTPLLIFMGVPPAVAVASSSNQIIAASFSGFLAHMRRGNVDLRIGAVMTLGGFVGSCLGVWLFRVLKDMGQIDLVISLGYVVFLGIVATLMAIESIKLILNRKKFAGQDPASLRIKLITRLPMIWPINFPKSNITVSAILPLSIGLVSGVLVALMGIGGGFVLIPAMVYLLGMPTSIVIGTSLFEIVFITSNVTILQSITTQTVDIVLALLMLTGSVLGAQIGTRIGAKFPAEQLRALLAFIVLAVVIRLAIGLFMTPSDPYTILLLDH